MRQFFIMKMKLLKLFTPPTLIESVFNKNQTIQISIICSNSFLFPVLNCKSLSIDKNVVAHYFGAVIYFLFLFQIQFGNNVHLFYRQFS